MNHTRRKPITPEQITDIRHVAQHIAAQAEVEVRVDPARNYWRGRANRLARIVLALTHPIELTSTEQPTQ